MASPLAVTTLELVIAPIAACGLVVAATYAPIWLAEVVGGLLRARRLDDALPAARIVARRSRT